MTKPLSEEEQAAIIREELTRRAKEAADLATFYKDDILNQKALLEAIKAIHNFRDPKFKA